MSLRYAGGYDPQPAKRGGCLRRLFFLTVLLGLAAGGAVYYGWSTLYEPFEHQNAEVTISIEPGTAPRSIIARLADAGIVRHQSAAALYLRLSGKAPSLKAGDYRFQSPISAVQAIDKIYRGDVHYERVTIPEGFNRFEIAQALAEKTGKATYQEFLALMNDTSLLAGLAPEARNLEGFLYPDTYNYSSTTSAADLIRAMVERFRRVFGGEWAARAAQLRMSVHEVVTLASIVEEEARVADERPLISSVFTNRLRMGMALGADPTFIYAAIMAGDYDGNPNQPRHRQRLSAYNTYIYTGLPPGPIASPGRASLEAALYPAKSDYLYFVVSGTDGRHKFSRSAAEHDAAVAEYRRQQGRGDVRTLER